MLISLTGLTSLKGSLRTPELISLRGSIPLPGLLLPWGLILSRRPILLRRFPRVRLIGRWESILLRGSVLLRALISLWGLTPLEWLIPWRRSLLRWELISFLWLVLLAG